MCSEIQHLQEEGKIHSSNSPWHSQAFVVHEPIRKPRIVINYVQTVNHMTPLDDDVVLCHTLPVFMGLGQCPIVN